MTPKPLEWTPEGKLYDCRRQRRTWLRWARDAKAGNGAGITADFAVEQAKIWHRDALHWMREAGAPAARRALCIAAAVLSLALPAQARTQAEAICASFQNHPYWGPHRRISVLCLSDDRRVVEIICQPTRPDATSSLPPLNLGVRRPACNPDSEER